MGQYFCWVNVDKHERLNSCFWDFAPMLHGRCLAPCEENQAALSLLATHWRGDVVVFCGDYADFSQGGEHPGCRHIQEKVDASGLAIPDFIYEARDATGDLRIAKDSPRNRHNAPKNELLDCYDGSFDVEIMEWRYVVNPARGEYIDYQRTPVVFASAKVIQRYDPLPLLLASATWALDDPEEEIEGRWLGDVVYPTNEDPSEGFTLIADSYVDGTIDWPVLQGVADDEVLGMMRSEDYDRMEAELARARLMGRIALAERERNDGLTTDAFESLASIEGKMM